MVCIADDDNEYTSILLHRDDRLVIINNGRDLMFTDLYSIKFTVIFFEGVQK